MIKGMILWSCTWWMKLILVNEVKFDEIIFKMVQPVSLVDYIINIYVMCSIICYHFDDAVPV